MDCTTVKKNLGLQRCIKLPALPRSIITTPDDFFFTTEEMSTPALFKTAMQDAILAGVAERIYLWPNFVAFEDVSEEAVYEDTVLAVMPVRDGQYRFRFHIRENICVHKAMYTHRSNKGRAFVYDIEGQLTGTEDEATGNFYGLSIVMIHTEKLKISDGSVSTKTPIYVVLADNKELDLYGAIADASFINTVDRINDVAIEVSGAFAATDFDVTVKVECDQTPVTGLVEADFILTNTAGVVQTIETVTELNGVYTITAPAGNPFEDGFLTLVAPADLTLTGYEVLTPLTVNIP